MHHIENCDRRELSYVSIGRHDAVLSELFVVGGSAGVYRWMRLCRLARYNHKYLFEGRVRGSGGAAPENLRDFGA